MIPPPPGAGDPERWSIREPGTLGVVDVVEVGFTIWARHWQVLALLSLLLSGLVSVVIAIVDPGPGLREFIEVLRTGVYSEEVFGRPSGLSQGLGLLSAVVLAPILVMATMRILLGAAVGSVPGMGVALLYGTRRLASTWWLYIALSLAVLGVAILLLIAGAILREIEPWLIALLTVPVLYLAGRIAAGWLGAFVVDDARGFRAIGRAWALGRGRWWPTAGALLLVGLITAALSLLGFLVQLVVPGSGDLTAIVQTTIGAISGALLGPISYGVLAVLYLDQRARHEAVSPGRVRAQIELNDPRA